MKSEMIQATGRRKSAIARVRLTSGEGNITVNERTLDNYFPRDVLRALILRPLLLCDKQRSVNLSMTVDGSGIAAQAGRQAVRRRRHRPCDGSPPRDPARSSRRASPSGTRTRRSS